MNFYIAPAGSPIPDGPDDMEGWTEIGWIDGNLTRPDVDDRPRAVESITHTVTHSFRVKGPKMQQPWFLFGPYKHPRQVLHNGRKPR